MSFSGAISPGVNGRIASRVLAVRPAWLRPVALGLILLMHAVLFFAFKGTPGDVLPLDSVDVTLAPLGDSAMDQPKVEESKPEEPAPPPQAAPAELAAPPPQVVAPEAIPLPVAPPKPVVKARPRVEKPDRPTPAELREQKRKAEEAAERQRERQEAREKARRGAAGGVATATGGMSRNAYAGLLAAELRRHTFYPAAARAAGVTGSVGVTFTVGPSGRVISQAVTRSSGNAALDSAAHAILGAVHTPPPPGGRFSASQNLHFGLH